VFKNLLCSPVYDKVCRFVLFFAVASASFSGFYSQCHFHEPGISGTGDIMSFERMIDGTANRPYIYRQMLPSLANWLDARTPQSLKDRLYEREGRSPRAYVDAIALSSTVQNKVYFFRYCLVYLTSFFFAVVAVYAMYLVCRELEFPETVAVLAPVVVMLLIPYFMMSSRNSGYFYDYPELAFLSLAIWVALRFDWWWLIPVAALGTWNKESFLFVMPALYPFIRRRTSFRGALAAVAVLSAVCLSVYFPERLYFAHNPGGTVEVQWRDQLASFFQIGYFVFASQQTYGIRLIKIYSLLPMLLLVWTIWRAWPALPLMVRRHAQIAAAINIPLYLLFCSPGELRDLSLLYVVLLLVLATNLDTWIESQKQSHLPRAA
jgi:hypothetical protein